MGKKRAPKKREPHELLIDRSRTKAAVKKCNVSSDFYGALDQMVRQIIADAERRALGVDPLPLRSPDLHKPLGTLTVTFAARTSAKKISSFFGALDRLHLALCGYHLVSMNTTDRVRRRTLRPEDL